MRRQRSSWNWAGSTAALAQIGNNSSRQPARRRRNIDRPPVVYIVHGTRTRETRLFTILPRADHFATKGFYEPTLLGSAHSGRGRRRGGADPPLLRTEPAAIQRAAVRQDQGLRL